MKRDHELQIPATETEEAELKELARLLGVAPPVAARRAIRAMLEQERGRAEYMAPEELPIARRRRRSPPATTRPGPAERYVELDETATTPS